MSLSRSLGALHAVLFVVPALFADVALASTPASQPATVPASATAAPVVVEWTGSALPGATGAASSCQEGADDSHDIVLAVPAGTYEKYAVTADVHIEFTGGTSNGVTSDPDLVLSVYDADGTDLGDSDGSGSEENVRIANPASGTLTAVVCPFFATGATAYKAKLTLTAVAGKSCKVDPTGAKSNALSTQAPGLLLNPNEENAGLANFDLFGQTTWNKVVAAATGKGYAGRVQPATYDRVLGTPSFLWASAAAKPANVGPLATEQDILVARARAHLRDEAKLLKLTPAMIDDANVALAGYNGNGPAVVRLRQRVNGLEVFQRYVNVLIDRDGVPVATSGYFSNGYVAPSTDFTLSAPQAIAKAWAGLGGVLDPVSLVLKSTAGDYQWYSLTTALSGSHVFEREPRVRRMYYTNGEGQLVPAYYVELFSVAKVNRNLSAYALMISAVDGSILHRTNLKASEVAPGATSKPWSYRMYADVKPPYMIFDEPLGNDYTPFTALDPMAAIARIPKPALPSLVSLSYGPIKTKDAWLTDDATQTVGNNVQACLDLFDPANGTLSTPYNTCTDPVSMVMGDFFAVPSSDHTFDYTAAPDQDPSTAQAQSGAAVSLFYLNNWLHDWWYDHGFDEASGNAQTDNYSRGGVAADPIKAQGQDGSGRNNANMATPADGSSPTMQQYLFNGVIKGIVDVKDTLNLGSIPFNGVEYGPQTFDYTGVAALGNDNFPPTNDGCTGLSTPAGPALPVVGSPTVPVPVVTPDPNLLGKIAVIPRGGGCAGSYKVRWAVESGASAVVLVHNADGPPPFLANGDIPVEAPVQPTNMVYQIPIVTVRMDDGKKIMDALAAGKVVNLHLKREATIDLDGTIDNQIVGHEFFHYVHHRLTDSTSQQTGAMSEGWADTDAMLISVRPDDLSQPDNDHWQGAYGLAGYVINNFYSGIRRAPYSTDFKKNAFTFKHISDGTPTPDGGAGAGNSEVHAAGEIWANEMWNCYAGILNTPSNGSFLEKQVRMQDYIITGFKMTPANATYVEQRDAVLSAVFAGKNFADYKACSDGFAVRGNGLLAVAPARTSTDLTGVEESYQPFVCKSATVPTTPTTPTVPVITPPATGVVGSTSSGEGRFGGAFGLALLLPMAGAAWRRRRQRPA